MRLPSTYDTMSAEEYFKEGLKEYRAGNYKISEDLFHSSLELDDQNPKVWNSLGIIYSKTRERENALTCFQNALLLDPDNLTYQKNVNLCTDTGKNTPKMQSSGISSRIIKKAKDSRETGALLFGLIIFAIVILLASIEDQNLLILIFMYVGIALIYVKLMQSIILGNSLKVTDDNFPVYKKMIEKHAKRCRIPTPNLYIQQNPNPNAYTLGYGHPYTIVLYSAIVELLEPDEIEAVIAHEVGHATFGHPKISSILSTLSNSGLSVFFYPINFILGFWSRSAEYSADNLSILMVEDPDTLIRALMKISIGTKLCSDIRSSHIYDQFVEVKRSSFHNISEWFGGNHPFLTNRIYNAYQFAEKNDLSSKN